ncbi:MAG: hypothetical protein WCF95_03555 [bacterium]
MSQEFIPYAPIIVAVMAFFIQSSIFTTPAQLERKHREIIDDCEAKFVSKIAYDELKEDFKYVKEKLDKIYDWMSGG